jgi:hypothetical protein
MAGAVAGPADFTFNIRDSVEGTRFEIFDVDLRADGRANVTSGETADRHPVPVPARVLRGGNGLTLVLDSASLAAAQPPPASAGRPPLQRFVFMAGVSGDVGGGRVLRDPLGSDPQPGFSYPDGRRCGAGPGC